MKPFLSLSFLISALLLAAGCVAPIRSWPTEEMPTCGTDVLRTTSDGVYAWCLPAGWDEDRPPNVEFSAFAPWREAMLILSYPSPFDAPPTLEQAAGFMENMTRDFPGYVGHGVVNVTWGLHPARAVLYEMVGAQETHWDCQSLVAVVNSKLHQLMSCTVFGLHDWDDDASRAIASFRFLR